MILISVVVVLIAWIMHHRYAKRLYLPFAENYRAHFRYYALLPAALDCIERLKMIERMTKVYSIFYERVVVLYGYKHGQDFTKMYIAQMISLMAVIALCGSLLAALSGDSIIFLMGIVLALLLPFIFVRDLDQKITKRKMEIIMELPVFLNKVILLVNAGETVQQAMQRSTDQANIYHPLYQAFHPLKKQLDNNYSFHQGMEEFNRRCGVQEVSVFTNTILLNYRRGGTELVTALRSMSHQLWETRKATAKTMGEEASAKLLFPLMLIFITVLVIVASPAIIFMNI